MKSGGIFSLFLNSSVGPSLRYEGLPQRHSFVGSFWCYLFSVEALLWHIDTKLNGSSKKNLELLKL